MKCPYHCGVHPTIRLRNQGRNSNFNLASLRGSLEAYSMVLAAQIAGSIQPAEVGNIVNAKGYVS